MILTSNPLVVKPFSELFSESLSLSPLPDTHPNITEKLDKNLEDEINATKSGETHTYLILWKGKAPEGYMVRLR